MRATSWIEVDLGAIGRNLAVIRRAVGEGVGVCGVIKADGYGLGAVRIARRLAAAGIDMLAVYTPDQARELVDAATGTPILLLMPVREMQRDDRLYRAALSGLLHLSVHDAPNLDAVAAMADRLGLSLPVHLDIDTGMARGGVSKSDAASLADRVRAHPRLRLAGVYSHLASADCDGAASDEQGRLLREVIDGLGEPPRGCVVHLANTFGVFRGAWLHAGMVRAGIGLLGYASEEFADPERFELGELAGELEPSVRWSTRVVHLRELGPGTSVGYGSTWKAQRRSRIALLPVGYADGYPIGLSNAGRVGFWIDARIKAFAPVVGRVSMDQITVDVTDLPESAVRLGAEAEVIGSGRGDPNALPELARRSGTIAHDLLCRLSPRVPRRYVLSGVEEVASAGTGALAGRKRTA